MGQRQPSTFSDADRQHMLRALRLAERGRGLVEPNPMVGCVICDAGGRPLAEGFHRKFGGPHAEVDALRQAERKGIAVRGGTAYVTLEPCCHHGKTPPCTDALLAAGISRVVIPRTDPFPKVAGGGVRLLRQQGVHVDIGLCDHVADDLLAPWLMRLEQHRPWIIAKWAQSIDGRLSTPGGHSQWISCEASRVEAHRLRGLCDAVLVGGQTLRQDDPLLLPRLAKPRRVPTRVVVSVSLELPAEAKLFTSVADGPVEVWTTQSAALRHVDVLKLLHDRGVRVVAPDVPAPFDRAALRTLLAQAAERGWTNVLVEGGGRMHGTLLDARLVDEVAVFVSPMLLGGHGTRRGLGLSMAGDGVAHVAQAPRVVGDWKHVGTDMYFRGRVTREPTAPES